jgi:hypothetical protein
VIHYQPTTVAGQLTEDLTGRAVAWVTYPRARVGAVRGARLCAILLALATAGVGITPYGLPVRTGELGVAATCTVVDTTGEPAATGVAAGKRACRAAGQAAGGVCAEALDGEQGRAWRARCGDRRGARRGDLFLASCFGACGRGWALVVADGKAGVPAGGKRLPTYLFAARTVAFMAGMWYLFMVPAIRWLFAGLPATWATSTSLVSTRHDDGGFATTTSKQHRLWADIAGPGMAGGGAGVALAGQLASTCFLTWRTVAAAALAAADVPPTCPLLLAASLALQWLGTGHLLVRCPTVTRLV